MCFSCWGCSVSRKKPQRRALIEDLLSRQGCALKRPWKAAGERDQDALEPNSKDVAVGEGPPRIADRRSINDGR